jgi:predicted SnoaL-like aldol condensation-catalyzing enzyme
MTIPPNLPNLVSRRGLLSLAGGAAGINWAAAQAPPRGDQIEMFGEVLSELPNVEVGEEWHPPSNRGLPQYATQLLEESVSSLRIPRILLTVLLSSAAGTAFAQGVGAPPPGPPPGAPVATAPNIGDTTNSAYEEQNKALVLKLLSEGFGGSEQAANETVAPAVIVHGKTDDEGVAAVTTLFSEATSRIAGAVLTVKHTAADGDFVAVQSHVSATPDNENSGEQWITFFRMKEGKVVEVWPARNEAKPNAAGDSPFADVYAHPNGAPQLTEEQEEANRQLIFTSNEQLMTLGMQGVIDKYWATDFIQHSPGQENGAAAFAAMFANMAGPGGPGGPAPGSPAGAAPGGPAGAPPGGPESGPPGGLGMLQAIAYLADADLVWEINRVGDGLLLVDIYRVDGNMIVEHYEIAPGLMAAPPAQ